MRIRLHSLRSRCAPGTGKRRLGGVMSLLCDRVCPADTFSPGGEDAECRPCGVAAGHQNFAAFPGSDVCLPKCTKGFGLLVIEKTAHCLFCGKNQYGEGGLRACAPSAIGSAIEADWCADPDVACWW
eukprot:g6702.t1